MSLFSSVIKGKGVQTAFCSLCSNTAGPARLLSSTARRTITDEQLKSNRSVGQARLQQEAAARQQFRRQKVGELTGVLKTVEIEGVAENSIMAQTESNQNRRQELPDGKVLHPGDFRKERMYPDPVMRRSTAKDALGPNRKKALQTDYFLNVPTPDGKGINPLNEYLNPELLSHFVTNMGKIMGRSQTQLTWKNQRRLGKAIRRARAMGLMPYFGDWSDNVVKDAKFKKWGAPSTGRK